MQTEVYCFCFVKMIHLVFNNVNNVKNNVDDIKSNIANIFVTF